MAKTLAQQLAAAELRANALRSKLAKATRSADTRRKIVVGGTVLVAMESDAGLKAAVLEILNRKVTRPNDRDVIADLLPGAAGTVTHSVGGEHQQHAAE